jgi:Tol biopolymer transport system component
MLSRSLFTALLALVAFAAPAAHAAAVGPSGAVFPLASVDTRVPEGPNDPTPYPEPEGGIFVAHGGRLNQLTENPADTEPAFSPDGRMIAFVRENDLYVMRADGSGQRLLTKGTAHGNRPIFSPDSRSILFERSQPAAEVGKDLYMIGVGGGKLRLVATTGEDDDHSAAFSPDGKTIVFVRTTVEDGVARDDLYSVRTTGVGLRQLTRTARIDEFTPRFSVAGIVFNRGENGDTAVVGQSDSAYSDIYVMRRDGRKLRKLVAGAGSSYVQDVTPNGRLLLFRREQGLWVKPLSADGREKQARKLIGLPDKSQTNAVFFPEGHPNAVFCSGGREIATFVITETATETRQTLKAISVATRRRRTLAAFSSLLATTRTTIGPINAWQPVR